MRAIGVIAGLTIKEVLRKKIFLLAILIGVIFCLLSVLPMFMGWSFKSLGHREREVYFPVALVVFLGIPMIRFFSTLMTVLLATGSLAGEIERGSLLVIIPRPINRYQALFGKWIGVVGVMCLSILLWAGLLWASLYLQLGYSYHTILLAACVLMLYPVIYASLSLFFSAFTGQILAGALTLLCGGVAWSESILVFIGKLPFIHLPLLVRIGKACAYVVPMSNVDRWVDKALGALSPTNLMMMPNRLATRPANTFDLAYIAAWTVIVIAGSVLIFQKRDL